MQALAFLLSCVSAALRDQDAARQACAIPANLFGADALQAEGVEPPDCDQSIQDHCSPNKRLAGLQQVAAKC